MSQRISFRYISDESIRNVAILGYRDDKINTYI